MNGRLRCNGQMVTGPRVYRRRMCYLSAANSFVVMGGARGTGEQLPPVPLPLPPSCPQAIRWFW